MCKFSWREVLDISGAPPIWLMELLGAAGDVRVHVSGKWQVWLKELLDAAGVLKQQRQSSA